MGKHGYLVSVVLSQFTSSISGVNVRLLQLQHGYASHNALAARED